MQSSIIWIIVTAIGLAILYFLLKTVFSWIGDFLGQSITFSKKIFIVAGIATAFFFWQYPGDAHVLFQSIWAGILDTYHSLIEGRPLID